MVNNYKNVCPRLKAISSRGVLHSLKKGSDILLIYDPKGSDILLIYDLKFVTNHWINFVKVCICSVTTKYVFRYLKSSHRCME